MLTFKHFIDKPLWAAADGYKFNIFDCISVAAININIPFNVVKDIVISFPDWEMREAPANLAVLIIVTIGVIIYSLTYWLLGIFVYFNCKRYAKKYRGSNSEIVLKNLSEWREGCDRRFNAKGD